MHGILFYFILFFILFNKSFYILINKYGMFSIILRHGILCYPKTLCLLWNIITFFNFINNLIIH